MLQVDSKSKRQLTFDSLPSKRQSCANYTPSSDRALVTSNITSPQGCLCIEALCTSIDTIVDVGYKFKWIIRLCFINDSCEMKGLKES